MTDSKMMEEYIERVLKKLGDDDLSKVEKVLGTKLRETEEEAQALKRDIGRLNETIRQAQARVKKLSDDYSDKLAKAAGFAESLIALKFGDELEEEEAKKKGNGSQDPSPPPEKKKARSRRAKSPRATAE